MSTEGYRAFRIGRWGAITMVSLAGGLLLGLGAGCLLPFVPFMVVVLAASAADVALSLSRGDTIGMASVLLIGLLFTTQFGYVLGLLTRALVERLSDVRRDRSRTGKGIVSASDIVAKE